MRFEIGEDADNIPALGVNPVDVGRQLCRLRDISKEMLASMLRIESHLAMNNIKIDEVLRKGDELIAKGDDVTTRGDELKMALEKNAATRE